MGGAVITFAMVESSSGADSASAMKDAIVSGVAGRQSIPPRINIHIMELELKTGRDAKVAATAADRPEKIGMILVIHMQELTIGCHNFGSQQVINCQSMLADEITDTAAQRDAAKSNCACITKACGESMCRCCSNVLASS